jgi:hypothetical protein
VEGFVEIVPEPTEEEREAIVAALAEAPPPSDRRGNWGRAALEDDEGDDRY